FTNEDFEIKRYSASVDSVVGVALKSATYRGAFISFIIMSMFGAIVAIMWKGGQLVAADVISPGDLITFVFVTVFIGASIAGIGDMFGQVQRAIGASERVLEILNQDSEPFYGDGSTEKINLSGDIEFNQVFFKYEDHGKYVIENLNFHVKEGERIALVGPSGAGKSTIIQLLMRFYTIDKGMVKIHGKNVYDFPLKEYRKNIGLVSQEVMLFGGSIRENIGYGKSNATEEEIIEAAKKAYAWDFIDKLPEGLNTIVGERGVKLSGGQKQRLAIARVILKNPSILILDEATSALDVESEHYVQLALEELMKDRTTIIIAHRLSTIRKVDKIMVINEGKVEESGSHDELMLLNGLYSNLVNIQFQEG
ncbi:MAG: ATP-binding cassette domain-containing protein, partial [Cyclobacteriaceae bacterium]|nr:ATP-binding cassette domain-containing protein [Cyclobacteriaceae bacterium]